MKLGTYDPIPKLPSDGEGKPFKDIKLDSARAKYWLGVGAQPSDPAWRLLSMVRRYAIGSNLKSQLRGLTAGCIGWFNRAQISTIGAHHPICRRKGDCDSAIMGVKDLAVQVVGEEHKQAFLNYVQGQKHIRGSRAL